jgi:ribosome maturation factor RimP
MELHQAASDLLTPLGYEVLELTISGRAGKRRILLRIDRLDGQIVSMEDVTNVTEVFSLELDRLDPFEGAYRLEVESPGPNRPLLRAAHFLRFHDLDAKVRVGNDQFTGKIRAVEDDVVTFEVAGDKRNIAISQIDTARLAEWPEEPR